MEFGIQPIFIIEDAAESSRLSAKVKFACELPDFEAGYNFECEVCTLSAQTDWEAVLEFLSEYETGHTLRSYCSEIEKFILWLINIKQAPISGIKRTDWHDYIRFLENVPPAFCGARVKRFNEDGSANDDWRPFLTSENGLSKNSVTKAVKIIESMFSFLVECGYLKASPVVSKRRRKATSSERSVEVEERYLQSDLLDLVIDSLHTLLLDPHAQEPESKLVKSLPRTIFIVQLLRELGLRASELIAVRMADFKIKGNNWYLAVKGKGSKLRTVKLSDRLKETVIEDRIRNMLPPYPLVNESRPLIGQLSDPNKPITTRRLGQIIHDAFNLVAANLEVEAEVFAGDSVNRGQKLRSASQLRIASTHWLRHSHATEFLRESGNDLVETMNRLGHSSIQTTLIYLHVDSD